MFNCIPIEYNINLLMTANMQTIYKWTNQSEARQSFKQKSKKLQI